MIVVCPVCCDLDPRDFTGPELCYECLSVAMALTQFFAGVFRCESPAKLTDDEIAAIEYAVAWLRSFPTLPTSKPEVREERTEVVARLDAIARRERAR